MLVDTRTESLVLNVRDPLMIRDLIPKSRLLDHPDFNVAVKLDDDSARLLHNIGIDAPSPINHFYNFPGKYKPFDHQQVMSAAMIAHQRVFNLSEMGCVSSDTEYLSPTGWRRIDQYAGGKVAQYWPAQGEIEFVQPDSYVRLPCSQMIRLHTSRGVDQLLSPEHRVLLAGGDVVSAQHIANIYGTQSAENRRVRFRTTFTVRGAPGIALTDAQIRLQVAVNADGYRPSRTGLAYIRLKKQRKIARMRQLLSAAEVAYVEKPCAPDRFRLFTFRPTWSKGFDERWWAATQAQLEAVADEAPHWDGSHRHANGVAFYSSLRNEADFIQYALSASGRRTSAAVSREVEWRVCASAGDPTTGLYGRNGSVVAENVRYEPSPDGFKYCFMVPSTFLLLRRNGCIVATGNTGKTASALWAADYMMSRKQVRKALILAPLSTLVPTWQKDLFDVLMHRKCVVVHGSQEKRLKLLAADVDFYIINHDGIRDEKTRNAIRKNPDINLVIVDEAGMFRNADTDRYKSLVKTLRPDMRLWLMTGTPCPNAPTDAWALARLVDAARVPQFFGAFKRQTMIQLTPFKWAPRTDAYRKAYDAMQPAVRFEKKNCLSLPPVITISRQCELTPEQRSAFNDMKHEMQIEAKAKTITAVNAADKINKLRQILCGSIKNTQGDDYIALPHGPRLKTLREAIDEAAAKAIVIVPFKGIIQSLAKELSPVYDAHGNRTSGYSVGVLNGDVSPAKRNTIISDFKLTPDPHILLCHPKVMAHGLNLTEADTLIFYGPIYSNDEFQQVIERFNRTGQKRHMTIVKMGGHPLEWEIYKYVDTKGDMQQSVLDLYGSLVSGQAIGV